MPPTPETDPSRLTSCLQRLAAGDLTARDEIIEVCADRLRLLAHRMLARFPKVRRWDDTDDVFQNAALRLHRALGQVPLDSPRSIMALAATQIHRELIDLARRYAGPSSFAANHATRAERIGPLSEGPWSPGVPEPPESVDPLERWTQFHEAIVALPAELREVFHLVWYLDADQKTIAAVLGCSERTVKTRWREAREAVRAALEGRAPE